MQFAAPVDDNLPFRHYSLRHRLISWISRRIFDRITYRVRHGLNRGMLRRGGLGWLPEVLVRGSATKEEGFWRDLPLGGLVVYDIGAYHGLLTMFFAPRCARVIAYEPNEANCARLIENICLNHLINVEVRKLGLGATPGEATLHYDLRMAGGGSLHPEAAGAIAQTIQVTTLDSDIARYRLPAPHLIKIDIEGWELEALQGARRTLLGYHPALFLEMHGETMAEKRRKVRDIVAFLRDVGYRDIWHVESDSAILPGMEPLAAEGHLYCRYTASRSLACPTNTSPRPPKATSASSR
jgi:FkbM family methyltransferase